MSRLLVQNTKLNIHYLGEERLLFWGFLRAEKKLPQMTIYGKIRLFSLNTLRLELSKRIYGYSVHKQ